MDDRNNYRQDSTKGQTDLGLLKSPQKSLSNSQWKFLVFGGLLPVVIFTVIETQYGVVWGTIAALTFGIGEVFYEKRNAGSVSSVTWMANGLILILGLVTIFTADGIWFKLQPAILEVGFAFILWGSSWMKKPMLLEFAKKQNPQMPPIAQEFLKKINVRLGFFFLLQAGLATWAALYWSTEAWAALKGLGLSIMIVMYLAIEILLLRRRAKRNRESI